MENRIFSAAPGGEICLVKLPVEKEFIDDTINESGIVRYNVYSQGNEPKATYEIYPKGLVKTPYVRGKNYFGSDNNSSSGPFGNGFNPGGSSGNKRGGPFGGNPFGSGFNPGGDYEEPFESDFNFEEFFNKQKDNYEERCRNNGRQPQKITKEDLETIMKAHKDVYKKRMKGLNEEYVDREKGHAYNTRKKWIADDYRNDVHRASTEFFNNHR